MIFIVYIEMLKNILELCLILKGNEKKIYSLLN